MTVRCRPQITDPYSNSSVTVVGPIEYSRCICYLHNVVYLSAVQAQLRPVHTRQQSCRKRQQIVAGTATLSKHLSKSPFLATICCRFRQKIVAFSATLLPGVDRPLGQLRHRDNAKNS